MVRSRSPVPPGPERAATGCVAPRCGRRGPATSASAHPGEAQRLRRERGRLATHHGELGAFGAGAVGQVQHHLGREAGRADPQPGEPRGVDHCSAHRRAVEGAEPRAGVDRASPAMCETQPLELGERLEEVSAQRLERRGTLLERRVEPAGVVVDGVVAAPHDPVVAGQPVVVELVRAVADALPPCPADGTTLLGGILAVIDETARHAGHADIIREQIDGVTGR